VAVTPVLLGDDPLALFGLASDLLDCALGGIETAVALTGSGLTELDVPTERAVHPRVPDLDGCCVQGGMLYVYVESAYPTSTGTAPFPQQHTGKIGCPSPRLAATFVIGYARCVEVAAEGIDPEDDQAVAQKVLAVTWAYLRGVLCCLLEWQRERPRVESALGLTTIVPDEGPCTGYETRVTVELPIGCSC
jgi:hypothetical protein